MLVTRVYRFNASHRLHCKHLSAEDNEQIYGKCNNPHGHGHDYVLQVTVQGEPEAETGRVVSLGELDRFVSEHIVSVYHGKDLNQDVPGLDAVPTSENVLADIARRLCEAWAGSMRRGRLYRVRLQETPRNFFEMRLG